MNRRVCDLEQWGADELLEWEAFYRLEPWGEERMDLRFATLMAIVLNKLNFTKDAKSVMPEDLMPDFAGDRRPQEEEPRELTPEEIREQALALCRTLGGDGDNGRE